MGSDFSYERYNGMATLNKYCLYNSKREIYVNAVLNVKYAIGSQISRFYEPSQYEHVFQQINNILRIEYNKTQTHLIDKKSPEYFVTNYFKLPTLHHLRYIYEDEQYRYYTIPDLLNSQIGFYCLYKEINQKYPTEITIHLDIIFLPKTIEAQQKIKERFNKLSQEDKLKEWDEVSNKNILGKLVYITYKPENKNLYYVVESFYNEDGEMIYSVDYGDDYDNIPRYHLDEDSYHKNMVEQLHSYLIEASEKLIRKDR